MLSATKKRGVGTVPLQNAVLCVDCETVSSSQLDVCPVCAGHSLLNISRILGGTIFAQRPRPAMVLFDMEISIRLKQMEGSDLTTAVKGITEAIQPSISKGRALFHINVEPAAEVDASYEIDEPKAA
jgi:hypothetical protein